MDTEVERLLALDKALRVEADRMLAESGIGEILDDAGYAPVGSYAMHTMTWRDLDFERPEETPDWERHWEVGRKLAMTGWCVRLVCTDNHRSTFAPRSLFWGLRVCDRATPGPVDVFSDALWKLDVHSQHPDDHDRNTRQHKRWRDSMTEGRRAIILTMKEQVRRSPEYQREALSVHIYEAVLEEGIRDIEGFRVWWEAKYRKAGEAQP